MSLRARKPTIFAFVLGALALGAVMIYSFGGRELVARHESFLVYFTDTVNGLGRGSPVKFNGVPIGFVDSIRFDYRQPGGDRRVPVLIQLNVDRLQQELGVPEDLSNPAVLAAQIQRGLRAELEIEHHVSGTMAVELKYHSPAPAYTPAASPPGRPGLLVIPSIPSSAVADLHETQKIIAWLPTYDFRTEIEKIGDEIDSITTAVSVIPYTEYNRRIVRTLGPLSHFDFPAYQSNFDNFLARLDRYQNALGDANRLFYEQSQDFVAMNVQTRGQFQQFSDELANLRATLRPDDPSLDHLTHNFEQLSKDMQNLTAKLNAFEQQPGLLDKVAP